MATPFITASQVGSYFIAQYYQMLRQQPEFVHQLYSEASTMLRIDGHNREAANSMLQIHSLVMSLRFSAIEIKTAHSLESWNRGVIVMVTGSAQMRDFRGKKKFAQTFFLAPQEKGYFVLSDIFHFIDEEQIHPYPAALLAPNSLNAKLNLPPSMPESVPSYLIGGGMQGREYMAPVDTKENGTVDKYPLPEQRLQQVATGDSIQDNTGGQVDGFLENAMNAVQEVPISSVEESISEPQKHTYASVLCAKGQSAPPPSTNKNTASPSEWHQSLQQNNQQYASQQSQQLSATSVSNESLEVEAGEEISLSDEKGEIKSVYVRNLAPTVLPSEIEEEFNKFGKIRPAGVAIRRLKDTDVCYAFVEFEDISAVQDAIKAATAQVAGRQVYIEERRANSSFARGRRGRGRSSFQSVSSRGRFGGRSFGRGGSQGGERDYTRSRGNGYYRQTTRQDKGYSASLSRNGHAVESTA